jgi:hypothetical protein
VPAAESLRIAGRGHLLAGQSLATAVRRTWFPIIGLAALGSRRARRVAALSLVPALLDGGPARVLDDASYGVGVWRGMIAKRNVKPIVPALTAWPIRNRRTAIQK